MKRTKKLFSLALAFIMAMALVVPAFAAQGDATTKGTITIDNAVSGQDYTLYRIFDLESFNTESSAYAYKINSTWGDWAKTQTNYVTVDDQGYVTWVNGASAADFAKAAQAHVAEVNKDDNADNNIAAQYSVTASSTTVTFTDVPMGYYLLDSSLGTLCSLNTTTPNVTIREKTSVPSVTKTVQEDSKIGTANEWGSSNTADIGQTVNFKSTITIPVNTVTDATTGKAGVQNLVLHDDMDEVLVFQNDIAIYLNGSTTPLAKGADKDYTVETENLSDGCTFEVRFTESFLNSLIATEDTLVVTYSAVVSTSAVADAAYVNTAKVSYGEKNTLSPESSTTTKTYDFNVKKITDAKALLTGAEFVLSKNADGSNPISFVKTDNEYRLATSADTVTTEKLEAGEIHIYGLDADTYYLKETKAPDGYNLLAASVYVRIEEDGKVMIENPDYDANNPESAQYIVANNDLVAVVNHTGALLPSTGGMGTTIFYVVGGVLMAGAAILLITKKKMSNEQ